MALVATAAALSAPAAPAAEAPFSTKSFGEGGGYTHPDAAVGQYFETKPEKPARRRPRPSEPRATTRPHAGAETAAAARAEAPPSAQKAQTPSVAAVAGGAPAGA